MGLLLGNPFNNPDFKKLFAFWNRVLEENGHEEIEDFNAKVPVLRSWECSRRNSIDPICREAKSSYFEMAQVILRNFPFPDQESQGIWELHCQGLSIRQIARRMKREKSKNAIHKVILDIRAKAGLKHGT
jgi:hypothetical protein